MNAPVASIGYWYDPHTRSWVVQLRDADRNQIGDAFYSGTRTGMCETLETLEKEHPDVPVVKVTVGDKNV